jgi:glycosyltransferase involved in cell wall biosynthesis
VRYLSRGLRDLGHEVTVISGPPYAEVDEGVELVRLRGLDLYSRLGRPVHPLREIRRPIDLYEYLAVMGGFFPEPLTFGVRAYRHLQRNDGFDVVHDNQSLSYGLLGMMRWGLPVVATVHHPIRIDRDLELAAASNWRERLKLRRWYSFLAMQGFVSRRLSLLISVSESSARESIRAFGLRRERVRTVYNGVDTEQFRAPPGAQRHPARVVVVNSADTPLKGLDHLYGAIERLACRRPVEVLVVGEPRDRAGTEADLRRRGIDGHLRFLGKLDQRELVEVYSEATVAVLPSLYEGFGFPAAEAMACEVPVVAYDAGALREVIGADGLAGQLAPLGDQDGLAHAIEKVLDDPATAARMGAAGRDRVVTRFSWSRAARETAALYEEVRGQTAQRDGGRPC